MTAALMELRRRLEFARHVPPRQLLRRVQLMLIRRGARRATAPPSPPPWEGPLPARLSLPAIVQAHGWVRQGPDGWQTHFLGQTIDLGPRPDWTARDDDPRAQLWRMNLHYFDYLDAMPDEAAVALIDDWIAACRPAGAAAMTAAWTPYAVSLRISAWLRFWSARPVQGDPDFGRRLASALRESADFLAANLETDVRGNHLIKNIRALAEAGAAFDDARAARWRAIADALLAEELAAQVLADGVHFERSPAYHAQVFADLLAIAAVRPRQDSLAHALDRTLAPMAQALADLTHPDGLCAQFNDCGLHMGPAPHACLAGYQAITGREAPRARERFALPAGGFHGARGAEGEYLVARMGPLGPDALMAHAHGDWGSFEWSLGGRRVIVDQGVFEYVDGPARRVSRSSASHNTLMAGEVEQADFFGAFRCGARPRPAAPAWRATEEGVVLEGVLAPAGPGPRHQLRRTLSWAPGRISLHDRVQGAAAGPLHSRLLLHPDVRVTLLSSAHARLVLADGQAVNIRQTGGGAIRPEPAQWWPDMGQAQDTVRLVATGEAEIRLDLAVEPRASDRTPPGGPKG